MAAAAGAGLGILGTVGSTIGQVNAATAQANALQAQGRSITEAAAYDERQQRRAARLMQGEANAAGAASGVSVSSGSPLLLELDRVKQSELEAQNIRRTGQIGTQMANWQANQVRKSIPYTILGGAAQSGSILSNYIGNRR